MVVWKERLMFYAGAGDRAGVHDKQEVKSEILVQSWDSLRTVSSQNRYTTSPHLTSLIGSVTLGETMY